MPQKQRRDGDGGGGGGGGNCIVQNSDQNVGKAEEKQEEVEEDGVEEV